MFRATRDQRNVRNVVSAFSLNVACAAFLALAPSHAGAGPEDIPAYAAIYQFAAKNKGTVEGTVEIAVRYDGAAANYQVVARLSGVSLAGLTKPVVVRVFFRLGDDGLIRPLVVRAEDGTQGGPVYEEIRFDWDTSVVVTRLADGRKYETRLDAKTAGGRSKLRRLMEPVFVIAVLLPGRHQVAGVEPQFEYVPDQPSEIETAIGKVQAESYILRIRGEPVPTTVWVAPALGDVPVRFEDAGSGRSADVGTLVELHGIEPSASAGSAQP